EIQVCRKLLSCRRHGRPPSRGTRSKALGQSDAFAAPRMVTFPPAFSIAAIAPAEAPATSKESAVLRSPFPRMRTPSFTRRTTPAAFSVSTVMGVLASSLPASTAACTRPMFTSLKSLAKMLVKPRFGRRRCSGIWPPSKPLIATPVRDFWPLTPRPPVLPLPEPMPRPTRMRSLLEPGLSLISLSFIELILLGSDLVHNADEVSHLGDHAANRRGILQRRTATDPVKAEADQRCTLISRTADRAAGLLDGNRLSGAFRFLGHWSNPRIQSALTPRPRLQLRRRDGPAEPKP